MEKEQLTKWKQLAATLKTIKAQEMELRKALAAEIMQGKFGTVNLELHGYKVKCQQYERQKIDNEALLAIWSDLSEAEKACIKWVPEIVVSNYNAIARDAKKVLDSTITTVPNSPTLNVTVKK